jgi:hypothetical protein
LPQAATTRKIQVDNLPDSIPNHMKDALTVRCSIPDAIMYDYDSERGRTHQYILVKVKQCLGLGHSYTLFIFIYCQKIYEYLTSRVHDDPPL